MRFSETEKKQLIIFAAVAYGITYVLGLLMWYGNSTGADLSAFPMPRCFIRRRELCWLICLPGGETGMCQDLLCDFPCDHSPHDPLCPGFCIYASEHTGGTDGNVGMDDTGPGGTDPGKYCILDHPSGVRKRKKGSLGTSVEELEKIDFMYAFVLWALQSPHGNFLCPGRTDRRICPVVDPAFYLALSGYTDREFLPGSGSLFR